MKQPLLTYSDRIGACPALFPSRHRGREQAGEGLEAHTDSPLAALKVRAKSQGEQLPRGHFFAISASAASGLVLW